MVSRGEETTLIDFFVAAPGRDGTDRGIGLVPVPVHFDEETVQTFYVGPASCGVPGTAAGAGAGAAAVRHRRGGEPGRGGGEAGARGRPGQRRAGLHPRHPLADPRAADRDARGRFAPRGRPLGEGDVFRFPALAEALERFGAEGAEPFYPRRARGGAERLRPRAGAASARAGRPGGRPTRAVERRTGVRGAYRGCQVLTNPCRPPRAGS